MLQRALIAFAFVLALLFAQQAGLWHALSHLARTPAPAEQHVPHGKVCPDCVAFAEIGAAVAVTPPTLAPGGASDCPRGRKAALLRAIAFAPYQSRAPPLFLA